MNVWWEGKAVMFAMEVASWMNWDLGLDSRMFLQMEVTEEMNLHPLWLEVCNRVKKQTKQIEIHSIWVDLGLYALPRALPRIEIVHKQSHVETIRWKATHTPKWLYQWKSIIKISYLLEIQRNSASQRCVCTLFTHFDARQHNKMCIPLQPSRANWANLLQ